MLGLVSEQNQGNWKRKESRVQLIHNLLERVSTIVQIVEVQRLRRDSNFCYIFKELQKQWTGVMSPGYLMQRGYLSTSEEESEDHV